MSTDLPGALTLLAALALVLAPVLAVLLLVRLQALENQARSAQLAAAQSAGTLDALAQQLGAQARSTQQLQGELRQAVDARLEQAVAESRSGRAELLAALALFEGRLEQRLDGLQQALAAQLAGGSQALLAHLAQGQADAASARRELSDTLTGFRAELSASSSALAAESTAARTSMAESTALFGQRMQQRFDALGAGTQATLDALKADIQGRLAAMAAAMSGALKDQLEANGGQSRNQFALLQDALAQQLAALAQGSRQTGEQLRAALNERLAAIEANNTAQLEAMRRTVDEKLHATLEQRLGASFKLVSDRLEQVHKGLGEMQTLAGSVGDLKRVMSNVKARGTWGEMQLGAIIENVLTPGQYARNVKTAPGSDELVEFAIRLPGRGGPNGAHPVWLPIDAKYPVEHYQRLMDAQDAADKPAMLAAGNAFEASIRLEARKIFNKYVSPPHTTDFAVLYLPTESLFAEVMRRPGLLEALQNDCRVMLTGPANLAAMLNSLQMGFKTLAIEQRSSEVWGLLGTVKTEFAKFGEVVEATKKSIDAAARRFDEVGVRTRAIERRLREVQHLPAPAAVEPAGAGAAADADADGAADPDASGAAAGGARP